MNLECKVTAAEDIPSLVTAIEKLIYNGAPDHDDSFEIIIDVSYEDETKPTVMAIIPLKQLDKEAIDRFHDFPFEYEIT